MSTTTWLKMKKETQQEKKVQQRVRKLFEDAFGPAGYGNGKFNGDKLYRYLIEPELAKIGMEECKAQVMTGAYSVQAKQNPKS